VPVAATTPATSTTESATTSTTTNTTTTETTTTSTTATSSEEEEEEKEPVEKRARATSPQLFSARETPQDEQALESAAETPHHGEQKEEPDTFIHEKTLVRAASPQLASAAETPDAEELALMSAAETRAASPQLISARETLQEDEQALESAAETPRDEQEEEALESAHEPPAPPTGFFEIMLNTKFLETVSAFFHTGLDLPNITMFTVNIVDPAASALERCDPKEVLRVMRPESYEAARNMIGGSVSFSFWSIAFELKLYLFSDDDP